MLLKRTSFLLLLLAAVFTSCKNDKQEALNASVTCNTSNVSYSGFVNPVMRNTCLTCHGATVAASAGRGVVLEGHANLQTWALNGQLVKVINHAPGVPAMPQSGPKLDDCTIAKIAAWVAAGAPNN